MATLADDRPYGNRQAIAIILAVTLLAAGIRFYGLASPNQLYGDEPFYAIDAASYITGHPGIVTGPDPLRVAEEQGGMTISHERSWYHPPLGKLLIAAGIKSVGLSPFGWRLVAAIFGVAGVMLTCLLGLVLLQSPWWGGLAGVFVALDGLHIVHSRIAMLDIFLTTFLTAACLCLAVDWRSTSIRRGSRPAGRAHVVGSPWVLMAGMMFGAAVATKWSALFLMAPAAVLWTWRGLRQTERRGSARVSEGLRLALAFVVVPTAIYLGSYTLLFVQHGPDPGGFVSLQRQMYEYQVNFNQRHPQASSAPSLPLMIKPFHYYPAEPARRGVPQAIILGVGNPLLWWGWLEVVPALLWAIVTKRRAAEAVAMAGYLALYLPWLVARRTEFFFYMLPTVPFMAIGTAAALRSFGSRHRWVGPGAAIGVGAAGIAFMPFWLGLTVPLWWSDHLHWLSSWR